MAYPLCYPSGQPGLNAKSFFDLALTARITNKFNLRFGANNILDTDPPVAGGEVIPAGFGNGNTYPQVYDRSAATCSRV